MKQYLRLILTTISIVSIPCIASGIEPIGTIGQPSPEQHAFINNDTILRVVRTHIQLVDTKTGEVIDEFGERTDNSKVVISPTASQIAIFDFPTNTGITEATIWDTNTRNQVSQWEINTKIHDAAAFSPTQPILATHITNEIHLWDWQTGKAVGEIARRNEPLIRAMVFSKDGKHLLVGTASKDVELWGTDTYSFQGNFEGYSGNRVKNIVISPDGTVIATSHLSSNTIFVSDLRTRRLLWRNSNGIGRIASMVFSPDGKLLFVANQTSNLRNSGDGPFEGWDDKVSVWEVESGMRVDTFSTDIQFLDTIALSPDGKTLLLHYSDAVVQWNVDEKKVNDVWADFINTWFDMRLTPDGKTFVTVSRYYIKSWDITTQKMLLFVSAEGGLFRNFSISPDGEKLAVAEGRWGEIRNLQTGKIENKFRLSGPSDIVFSSTGKWVAGQGPGRIHLINVDNPDNLKIDSVNDGPKVAAGSKFTFSDDDNYIAASTYEGSYPSRIYKILLWRRDGDTFSFQYAWEIPEYINSYFSRSTFITGSDKTMYFAVPIYYNKTQIWKLLPSYPRLFMTLDVSYPLHFTPDGTYLIARKDANLQIWDWQVNTLFAQHPIHNYVDLSRNGKLMVSLSRNKQIQIWEAEKFIPFDTKPTAVDLNGKQFITLGQIKRNQLMQNFPNPFNPETWIPFQLANESVVTIHIYTPSGKLVRTLTQGILSEGRYATQSKAIHWDGQNDDGEPVSSGIYLYTINTDNFTATRKMIIRK